MHEFQIGSSVTIKASGISGTVDGIFTDRHSTQFRVEYVNTVGSVCNGYFDADQLQAA